MAQLSVPSPLGTLLLTADDDVLTAVAWSDARRADETPLLRETAHQLDAYFAGKLRDFELPMRLAGSNFQRSVWQAMCRIPYGETRSYGEVAAELGSAARAVGGACGRNPIPIIVPCHRILAAASAIGGYSGGGGTHSKRFLLALEGTKLPDAAPLPLFETRIALTA
ncbi:MAG: cysteine methyltransferase [Rhodospirillales bacterium]|nr:cysteine methyltransferase [Rhodospirillales bacterium]